MKIIDKLGEEAMIASFLKAELYSPRFKKYIHDVLLKRGINLKVVSRPKLGGTDENRIRYQILTDYRGYGTRTLLFDGFPDNIDWYEAELTRDEVKKIKYVKYSYWNELSDNTRLPAIAARNLKKGRIVFNEPNDHFFEAAEALKRGKKFPELILVAKDKDDDLVAVEGHLRLTAYALEPKMIPHKLKVIVGFSKDIEKWKLY